MKHFQKSARMKIDVDDGSVLWYSIENETPTQIAVINLGGCFVLGATWRRTDTKSEIER